MRTFKHKFYPEIFHKQTLTKFGLDRAKILNRPGVAGAVLQTPPSLAK